MSLWWASTVTRFSLNTSILFGLMSRTGSYKNEPVTKKMGQLSRLVINLGPTTCQRTYFEPDTSNVWTCIGKGFQPGFQCIYTCSYIGLLKRYWDSILVNFFGYRYRPWHAKKSSLWDKDQKNFMSWKIKLCSLWHSACLKQCDSVYFIEMCVDLEGRCVCDIFKVWNIPVPIFCHSEIHSLMTLQSPTLWYNK